MSKNIIANKVQTSDNRVFTVQKVAASESDIIIDFGQVVSYNVVKLDLSDLPTTDPGDGATITWINNWGVMDNSGNYVASVNYTVFLPTSKKKFIYHDQRGLGHDKTPASRGTRNQRAGMVQVDFSTGDPGAGWK